MKAALLKNIDEIRIADVVLRDLRSDEILVNVGACGICGTDVTSAIDGRADFGPFGHEVAGTVASVGAGVLNVAVGDKIVLDSSSACGYCDACKDAKQELCTNVQSMFHKGGLAFAEQMIAPAISAVKYSGIAPEHACLSEPLGVAIDMTRLGAIEPGSHVVVSGLGAIGLMAVQLAKLAGAEKIYAAGTSRSRFRSEMALNLGADEIIEADETPLDSYPFKQRPNRFLVTSPQRSMPPMFTAAATGAIISFIGIQYGEGATITLDANEFHFKKLQLRASYASPAMFTPQAVRLLTSGAIDAKSLVTHVFDFDDIHKAMRVAAMEHDKALKVVMLIR